MAQRLIALLFAVAAAALPAPAAAGVSGFTLVNGSGLPLGQLSIRRTGGQDWQTLTVAPSPGARSKLGFTDVDCAFDIRASLAGGKTLLWSGVNLCEVATVTLNQNASGVTWVDYD